MSSTQVVLWGINRPDGTPVTKPPAWGSSLWREHQGQYGYAPSVLGGDVESERTTQIGAEELAETLVRQGVKPEEAAHEVVKVVITTTVERQADWEIDPLAEGLSS